MAALSIRNLDDDVVERLKLRARLHNRSLEAEVRRILEQESRLTNREFLELADAIRERVSARTGGMIQPDSTLWIREDRDSR
jgi:antitoxin FitA